MASIKDALEESINERGSLYKYIIFSIPLFYTYKLYLQGIKGNFMFTIMAVISALLVIGIVVRCANNVMNYRDNILPTFNIFKLFWDAIVATLAISPWAALNTYIAVAVTNNFIPMIPVPWIATSAKFILYGVCGSIVLTAFMLYAKSKKVFDAYNLKIISDSCIDILIHIIWLVIQLAIVNGLIIGTITYLFWLFLGLENDVLIFIWGMTVVLNAAMIGNYLGQMNYEALHHDD